MSDRPERQPFDDVDPGCELAEVAPVGPPPPEGMSVAALRELFRMEARELLSGMGARLSELGENLGDARALAEIAARGHALKGSAAMAELPCLSRAGAVLQHAAELAADAAQRNHAAARALLRATRLALEPAERMLADCVDGSRENQDRLFSELLDSFDPIDRHELEMGLRADEANEGERPDFEERPPLLDPESANAGSGIDDDLGRALAETFLIELTELLGEVPEILLRMADPSAQADLCADLARVFHTVKGSAATVGRDDLRDAGLALQQIFDELAENPDRLPLRPEVIADMGPALATLFLAAGLEPPSGALETLGQIAGASLRDGDDSDALERATRAHASASPCGDEEAATIAGIEPEIMEAFLLDADAALEASESALLSLERNPKDRQPLRTLFRQFHTLKGAGAAVGLTRISEQLHAGETLLEGIIEGAAREDHDPEAVVELLLELVDSAAGLIAEARGAPHEHRILVDVHSRIAEVLARESSRESAAPAPVESAPAPPRDAELPAAPAPAAPVPTDPESAIVRVHASRLDLLMNRVSELVVSRTRMEDTMAAVSELKDKLGTGRLRLHETVEGLRGFEFNPGTLNPSATDALPAAASSPADFTDLEFDKYDDFHLLARTLVELAADAGEMVGQLSGMIDTLAEETRQVSKVTSSLQRTITGMRLLSLDTLFRRLQRPTREAARQLGKQVDLICVGGEVQLDRALIESLYGPLLHLVRNAVSHGLESFVERRATGKPDVGLIEIRALQRHGSVEVSLRDDGRGLDFDAIRAKGIALGLIDADATHSRDDLAMLIFRPGFSTRSEVTDLSGRGIGMDVVAGEVEHLRGSVSIESRDGKGAVFRITLPLTAVIDQVLLLRAGSDVFALSNGPIETVLNIDGEHLIVEPSGTRLRLGEEILPTIGLAALAGIPTPMPPATAIVLRTGDQRVALLADRIEAQREAVVRPLGRLFAGHPFVSSATFSGDGQVIFVLDASRLENWIGITPPGPEASRVAAAAAAAEAAAGADDALVLWADDSISLRTLAAHFLTAEGFTSRTAVDGRDALEKLRRGRFSVVVTDLEMPRMHGYELLREIRSDPRLRHLPVIVCSSRSSEKHRRAAREAGANGYLTKPFTREALAEAIREFVV